MNQNTQPLKLNWWRGKPNFGDALSQLVVAHVSGRPVEHAKPWECDLFGIGSLLHVVRKQYLEPTAHAPWLWGTGALRVIKPDFLSNVQIAILRGPITAALLDVKTAVFGDPGLLSAEVLGPVDRQDDKIALVPHHTQMDDPRFAAMAAMEPALKLIDVAGPPETVCREIARCKHVISASLHGLIVADSYSIQILGWTRKVRGG